MFRFLNAESKTVASAAAIVGVLSFVSRLFGLARDRILAGTFGAGDILDAYYAAFKVPDLLFNLLVVGAVSASFIPLFTRHIFSENKERAWRLANNMLHIVLVAMALFSSVIFIFSDAIAWVVAPGFIGEKRELVALFMRIMLFAQILLAGSSIFGSVLQGSKRFFLASMAPIFYNLGIIAGALFLVPFLGPTGLAWGVAIGAFLHAFIQWFGSRLLGYRHAWILNPFDAESREIIRMMGPRALSLAVSQVQFLLFTVIASLFAAGSVTVFQFAYNIQFFAVGIVGVSYAIAVFPSFSEALGAGDTKRFVAIFSQTVREVLFLTVPVMMLMLVLRAQAVRLVVGAGMFGWNETYQTMDILAWFLLSMAAQGLVYVLARAFFAMRDTATPLASGIISATVGVVSAWYFSRWFGVKGLAMAFSLASFLNLATLWIPLRLRIGSLDESRIIRSLVSISVAGLCAAIAAQFLKPFAVRVLPLETFMGVFFQATVAGGAGLFVYGIVAYALRSEELHNLLIGVRRKFFKQYHPKEALQTDGEN